MGSGVCTCPPAVNCLEHPESHLAVRLLIVVLNLVLQRLRDTFTECHLTTGTRRTGLVSWATLDSVFLRCGSGTGVVLPCGLVCITQANGVPLVTLRKVTVHLRVGHAPVDEGGPILIGSSRWQLVHHPTFGVRHIVVSIISVVVCLR